MLWWTLRQLSSENVAARQKAAQKLGESREPRALEPLVTALKDKDSSVRQAAEEALKRIDAGWAKSEAAQRVIPTMVAALKDEIQPCGGKRRMHSSKSAMRGPSRH